LRTPRRPSYPRRPSPAASLLLATALALPGSAAVAAEPDPPRVRVDHKGLRVDAGDAFSFRLGGRLHADAAFALEEDAGTTDGTEIRRGRLYSSAVVHEDWRWIGEVDFADNGVSVKDFTVDFRGFDRTVVSVGHQKQPYSLALEMSSNDISFIERGIDTSAITPLVDRAIGVRADAWGEHWFAAAGFYGDGVSPDASDDRLDDGMGFAGRLVAAPIREDDRVVHVGFRGAWRMPSRNELATETETTHFSNLKVLDFDAADVDSVGLLGPELAVACGRLTVLGEYNLARVDTDGGDFDVHSAHVSAAVMLTGESRAAGYAMKSGEFKRIAPAENLSLDGGLGAFELAARWAWVDLDDAPGGGEEQELTVALNWHLNPNVRLMVDYIRVLDVSGAGGRSEAEGLDTMLLRTQFAF